MEIKIIDYGIGNIASVAKAIKYLGFKSEIISNDSNIQNSDIIALPGVSSFGAAVQALKKRNLFNLIINHINAGGPYIGICIGMQLLFEESEETPGCEGFNIFRGKVKKFPNNIIVPHMGWNSITLNNKNSYVKNIFKDVNSEEYFYFVHSYYCSPDNNNIIGGYSEYENNKFVPFIIDKNITGFQFHPEKSQTKGLQVLKNTIEYYQNNNFMR